MAARGKGRTLPKFGEWNNGENGGANVGYTVIFDRAREDKTKKSGLDKPPNSSMVSPQKHNHANPHHHQGNKPSNSKKKKWKCFG